MLNLLSLATSDETANAVTQQAASEKYVLMTARYWLSPVTSAALNDGQNTHKNSVPEILEGHLLWCKSLWQKSIVSPVANFFIGKSLITMRKRPTDSMFDEW